MNRFCVLLYYEFLLATISPLLLTWPHYHAIEPSIELTFDFMMLLTSRTDVLGVILERGGYIEVM